MLRRYLMNLGHMALDSHIQPMVLSRLKRVFAMVISSSAMTLLPSAALILHLLLKVSYLEWGMELSWWSVCLACMKP